MTSREMAREALQLQLDNLMWNLERLEAENALLRDDNPEHAALLNLRGEIERYKEENSRLLQDIKKKRKDRRSMDPTVQSEADTLVEQQRQLCEDL